MSLKRKNVFFLILKKKRKIRILEHWSSTGGVMTHCMKKFSDGNESWHHDTYLV